MKKNMLVLIGVLLLLMYFNGPLSVVCTTTQIYDNFATEPFDFTCGYNQGCDYTVSCPIGYDVTPKPSASGTLYYLGSTRFYCENNDGTEANLWITLSVTGESCAQRGAILTPQLPDYFTTEDKTIVDVRVDGATEGFIVHGIIKELNLQKDGYVSFGIAELDFGYLARGQYTLEIWGQDVDRAEYPFEVLGVMDLSYSFVPLQPYNFVEGYIYLKDENDRGLSLYDINSLDLKAHPKYGLTNFPFTPDYIGKDDILGGKFHVTGNTQDYIGDFVIDVTIKKNGYVDATQQINVKTFIPSLVIEAYCRDLDCPFPNSATLDDTKSFKFYVKHEGQLVDASEYSVKVTSPSRGIVDQDITSSVLKSGIGTYTFSYGPFTEIEAWTFTIYVTYPGADPQTIYPKVSVTKEEPPIIFSPWLLLILVPVGYLIWRWWSKR